MHRAGIAVALIAAAATAVAVGRTDIPEEALPVGQ